MTSHLPPYDLNRIKAAYRDPQKERGALLALARTAHAADRFDDAFRASLALIRVAAVATPGADITPEERSIFAQSMKQVG